MNNRIKVLRAEKDWSQQTLADNIGVSRQAINAVERGKHDPSLQLAFDIANQFNQRIEEVFFPEENKTSE
jgi:putative transcriptional regulator